jgi:hypothetical protein
MEAEAQAETWKPIPCFPRYEASSLGRIRRIGHKCLKATAGKFGYMQLSVSEDGKKYVTKNVHRLVAAAFIGPCPIGVQVNHIDGNKSNNAIANLEYVTRHENQRHAFAMGLHANHVRGEHHKGARLKADGVRRIMLLEGALSHQEIADLFCISRATVGDIYSGRSWHHITGRTRKRRLVANGLAALGVVQEDD